MANSILGTSHINRTNLGNLLTWGRNYCEELGLIEVIKLSGEPFDKVTLTSLGSRFYSLIQVQQHIKRESIHLVHDVS